jgi:hypothetical protein
MTMTSDAETAISRTRGDLSALLRGGATHNHLQEAITTLLANVAHPRDAIERVDRDLQAINHVPPERVGDLWLAWHDLLTESDFASEYGVAVTVRLLEAVAVPGEEQWLLLVEAGRRERIETAALSSVASLAVLEQLMFCPPSLELRAFSLHHLETLGIHGSLPRSDVRAIEQLLHGFGEREVAYRVERARKRRDRAERMVAGETEAAQAGIGRLRGKVVTVAGGHPPLRRLIQNELAQTGIIMREVPPAFDAVRRERDVLAALRGSDVAVLLIAQLPHTTSDQVRSAAARLDIPVLIAQRASAVSVKRALEEWATSFEE